VNQSAAPSPQPSRSLPLLLGILVLVSVFALVFSAGRNRPPSRFPSMPDFGAYSRIYDMKAAFIDYLMPIVDYYNDRILTDRKQLKRISSSLADGNKLSWVDSMWLQQLAEQYAVAWNDDNVKGVVVKLLRRVDIIPVALVLVQAAKESSWGQSRFAVEAHNLFGQWCFRQGCGVAPARRAAGATHEVRRFRSASESVRSYLHNLNTHGSYRQLRRIRQRLREHHQPITATALADGLSFYSERREVYVEEIKSMIAQYRRFQETRVE
jgi:Bax protein